MIIWICLIGSCTNLTPSRMNRPSLYVIRCSSYPSEHGYTVIVAATNLAFRELYERAAADSDTRKLLVIDRTPQSRRLARSKGKAPPLFYPDLLARVPSAARIELDL